MVYSLVIESRKLHHYFQDQPIQVITNQPLKRILHRPNMTGRIPAWTTELSQFYIEYVPRTAMKAQVLTDFVAKWQLSSSFKTRTLNPRNHGGSMSTGHLPPH